jgi:hypothetical protein
VTYLCILADSIEKADITLVASHCQFTRLGCSGSREIVLASILLELTLDELVAGNTWIDPEQTIVRYY